MGFQICHWESRLNLLERCTKQALLMLHYIPSIRRPTRALTPNDANMTIHNVLYSSIVRRLLLLGAPQASAAGAATKEAHDIFPGRTHMPPSWMKSIVIALNDYKANE